MLWIGCDRCGKSFNPEITEHFGEVWYNGNLIGYSCNDCQMEIWKTSEKKMEEK